MKAELARVAAWGLLAQLALGAIAVAAQAAQSAAKPNIVVIVADDLGYAEVNPAAARQDIATPRIASLAKSGVTCTNGYVSCPVCSPTRAGLLTGRYQQRFGHEFNPGPPEQAQDNFGLPLSEITLANRLKHLGYATGMVGKWHLGFKPQYMPLARGYDEFFGFLAGAHSYVDGSAEANNPIYRGNTPVDEAEYLTDAFGREAVAFVDRHKSQPFFLYLTFNAVHAPLQSPAKYLSRVEKIGDERRRTFAAMLTAMDDNVGKLLDKLSSEKLNERTLIFFISDNGGPTPSTSSRNDPLRGFKAQTWEGGIRVPYLVQWKGQLPEGKVYDQPVISLDITPTAVAAAGGTVTSDHPVDGVNLLPYLMGEKAGRPHETLYWRFGPQWAIRHGDYKLVQPPPGEDVQLFHLASDVSESHDLAAEKPEVVKELTQEYGQWNAQLESPRWQRRASANGRPNANGNAKAKGRGKAKARQAAREQP
jgi:arylsulfatase A-like enzyme